MKNMENKIGVLDWGILFSILLLLVVVYIPSSIWIEEKKDRNESRFRMKAVANAAEFYKELKGNYTTDGIEMLRLVEASIDSLYADSLFTGDQVILVDSKIHNVSVEKGFDYRADTTFSIAEKMKNTIIDTIYMVSVYTDSILKTDVDTTYINSTHIKKRKGLATFKEVISIEAQERVEIVNNYLRKKYHLDREFTCILESNVDMHGSEHPSYQECVDSCIGLDEKKIRGQCRMKYLVCPLTKRNYILEIEKDKSGDEVFTVKSPVVKDDSESRYVFFKYKPGDHGFVRSGITSWAE